MKCSRCKTKDVQCEGDAICFTCQSENDLCVYCGQRGIYGNKVVCKECQLKSQGKCRLCDEPANDDQSPGDLCLFHCE